MNNCTSYMDTHFFKFLLFLGHGTMQVNQAVFGLIPLQLTDEEIQFIESMIKPMD